MSIIKQYFYIQTSPHCNCFQGGRSIVPVFSVVELLRSSWGQVQPIHIPSNGFLVDGVFFGLGV